MPTFTIAPGTDRFADETYRKVSLRLMPLLIACYVAAFIDRSNVGFAKLQFMGDLGFTEAIYGLGAALFYAGYMVFEVPSNLYLARRGVRRTILRIMVLWGLASAAMALMRSATDFYVLRALLGAAEAGFFPGVLLYLTFWIPASRRARFTSFFMLSIPLSGIIGSPLAGAIMASTDGAFGVRGWQWLFVLDGLPSCLLGIVAYRVLSDGPAQASWLTDAEKAQIADDLTSDSKRETSRHRSIFAALGDRRFVLLTVMAFALFTSASGMFLWMPTILRSAGMTSLWQIGLASAVPFSIGAVAQYLIGRHSDRVLERRWHAAAPALVGAVGWSLLPSVSDHTSLALLVVTIASVGTLGSMAPFWTMPPSILSGTAAAAGIALVSSIGSSGNFIGPMLVGWLATDTGSFAAGQYYLAGVLAIGALALIAIGPGQRAPLLAVRAKQA